mgnify:CR=1 FL=1
MIEAAIKHTSRIADIVRSLDERRTAIAAEYANDVADAAQPPVLTGALKSSVYTATQRRSGRAEAQARALRRRPKARFGKPRIVTQAGQAVVAWSVAYGVYVERRKPWVRRALLDAKRRTRVRGIV